MARERPKDKRRQKRDSPVGKVTDIRKLFEAKGVAAGQTLVKSRTSKEGGLPLEGTSTELALEEETQIEAKREVGRRRLFR